MIANDPSAQTAAQRAVDPSALASAASAARQGRRSSFSGRLSSALREDAQSLHPRRLLVDLLVGLIPRSTLHRLRTGLYRAGGYRIGPRTLIFGKIEFNGPGKVWQKLKIGADGRINTPLFLDLNAPITIGDNVAIGHHVIFVTAGHEIGPPARRCGALAPAPIVIEDGCWIGACCTIMPGVTIGRGSVVSVGSVVSADVPPNKLVGGVPARPIKTLSEEA